MIPIDLSSLQSLFSTARQSGLAHGVYQFSFVSNVQGDESAIHIRVGEEVVVCAGRAENPDLSIILDCSDLVGCLEGRIRPQDLYSSRRLRFERASPAALDLLRGLQVWLERSRGHSQSMADPAATAVRPSASKVSLHTFQEDAVLCDWINASYLDPQRLRALQMRAAGLPLARYLVLDNFFCERALEQLIDQHNRLEFSNDDEGLNFDSRVVIPLPGREHGCDLFFSPMWHHYIATALGVEIQNPGRAMVRLRRHDGQARGFWPHSDRVMDERGFRTATVLCYFNREWRIADGALLQIWHSTSREVSDTDRNAALRWSDYFGQRLDFLDDAHELTIEVPEGSAGVSVHRLLLIDQIPPECNRVVICDLTSTLMIHSVTPSAGRTRDGFVQWIY